MWLTGIINLLLNTENIADSLNGENGNHASGYLQPPANTEQPPSAMTGIIVLGIIIIVIVYFIAQKR